MTGQIDITSSRTKVFTPWIDSASKFVQWGNESPIEIPVHARYGCFRASDTHAIVGAQEGENVYLINRASRAWSAIGIIYGTNGVALAHDGVTPVYVNGPLTYKIGDQEFSRPNTWSEGFLYLLNDNTPFWFAPNRFLNQGPFTFVERSFSPDGNWLLGLVTQQGGVVAYNAISNTYYQVTTNLEPAYTIPRINNNGDAAIGLLGEIIPANEFVPISSNVPMPKFDLPEPFPQPIWAVAYHSHNLRPDYGDNPKYTGNCVLVVDGGVANVRRLGAAGYRLMINPNDYAHEIRASIVAYYLHCQTLNEAQAKISATETLIQTGQIIEAPVIVYYDDKIFPDTILDSVNPAHYWISLQCYRNIGESLTNYNKRVMGQLNKITQQGFYQLPTLQFYTLNGTMPVSEVVETFPLIRPWFNDHQLIGFLAFSDRRPSGMVTHPEFLEFFNTLTFQSLDAPARYTGWVPRNMSPNDVLKNTLSQNKAQFVLSKMQTTYIKALLDAAIPPPPNGDKIVPNQLPIVESIFNTTPKFQTELDAHKFVRRVAGELQEIDSRWGMLTKVPGQNQCTMFACGSDVVGGLGVDVLAYKFNDGTHTVVDILADFGPNATPIWIEKPQNTNHPDNHWTGTF